MFITEQQLALYKYQPQSRYYNWAMSDIVSSEYNDYMKQVNYYCDDVLALFVHFMHRKVYDDTWQYYFSDGSVLTIIELGSENGEKMYRFNSTYSGFIRE